MLQDGDFQQSQRALKRREVEDTPGAMFQRNAIAKC